MPILSGWVCISGNNQRTSQMSCILLSVLVLHGCGQENRGIPSGAPSLSTLPMQAKASVRRAERRSLQRIQELEGKIKQSPGNSRAHSEIGLHYNRVAMMKVRAEAIDNESMSPELFCRYAHLRYPTLTKKAVMECETGLRLASSRDEQWFGHYTLGVVLQGIEDYSRSIKEFEAALMAKPDERETWKELSRVYEAVGKVKEAQQAQEKAGK